MFNIVINIKVFNLIAYLIGDCYVFVLQDSFSYWLHEAFKGENCAFDIPMKNPKSTYIAQSATTFSNQNCLRCIGYHMGDC